MIEKNNRLSPWPVLQFCWLVARCKQGYVTSIGKNYVRQHELIRDGLRFDAAIAALVALSRLRLAKEGNQLCIQLNPLVLVEGE